ncbi:hypothetical protein GH714_039064 [Hevea brasiliensis]|uniref:RNase H type-1 domain-containing protein n=1 Tax=Hevea brasiliensis TaxID=3981 RepID=A0A6A6MSF9_HEVBR|nr:hypothetical protein GH714_039064 [Hevea brasiliensis]
MTVEELIDPVRRCWDINLLRGIFQARDVEVINSMPISIFDKEDTWIWHFDKRGKYSVKLAYHVARDMKGDQAKVGFEFVVRDCQGHFIEAGSGWKKGLSLPKVVAAFGLRTVLSWLSSKHFHNIQVEVDSKELVQGILFWEEDYSD